jgi:formate-dependent nitrite reductase membrane component NrfD
MDIKKEVILDRFEVRPTAQREWHILILLAFFFGAVGCGFFLISAFYRFTPGVVLSLLIIVLLMGIPHWIYLGHPLRVWRMFTSWTAFKTSWITRGMWGWIIFIVFGVLYIAPSISWFSWLPWSSGAGAGTVMLALAALAAVFGIVYPAFAMGQSPAIAFWNNPILPVLFILYGLIDGIDLMFVSLAVAGSGSTYAVNVEFLEQLEIFLLVFGAISIWAYLGIMSVSRVGSRESVHLLVKGELAPIFWGVVVIIGLVLPLAVGLYGYFVGVPLGVMGITGVLVLIGALYFKHVVLKAGVYSPQI